ncbi:MAG: hypothetical protein JWR38_1740 [Mucilaginibacter sp.]|nr:hypothetical protein [Mucilaginibacter sp.]
MTTIKSINIPNACHESWQQMTPVEQGRHCQLCCKTVTDFTSMTNNEIIGYLASANNVCGRFGEQQLTDLNHHLYAQTPPAGAWKRWVMMISLLGSTVFFKASAQTKPATVQTTGGQSESKPNHMILGKVTAPDSNRYQVINGQVTDSDNNCLPGVTLKIKGTNAGVVTGLNGKFTLYKVKPTDTIVFNFIGYESQEVRVGFSRDQIYNIVMKENRNMLAGEVIVAKKQSPIRRAWHKIKGIF